MSKEEKKAIEFFEKSFKKKIPPYWYDDTISNIEEKIKMILNLIEKQQKEIEKKDKIINEMADNIFNIIDYRTFIDDIENLQNEKCIIDYFTNKVDKEGR